MMNIRLDAVEHADVGERNEHIYSHFELVHTTI